VIALDGIGLPIRGTLEYTLQLHKRMTMWPVSGLKSRRIVEVLALVGVVCETHLGCDSSKVGKDDRGERLSRKVA
jgi:hypothetical protein